MPTILLANWNEIVGGRPDVARPSSWTEGMCIFININIHSGPNPLAIPPPPPPPPPSLPLPLPPSRSVRPGALKVTKPDRPGKTWRSPRRCSTPPRSCSWPMAARSPSASSGPAPSSANARWPSTRNRTRCKCFAESWSAKACPPSRPT